MKTAKKFTSFDELKSSESKMKNHKSSLKKHNAFEKFIKDMKYSNVHKKNLNNLINNLWKKI